MDAIKQFFSEMGSWLSEQFISTFVEKNRYMLFLTGFRNTLIISFAAIIIGIVLGMMTAVIRVFHAQTGKFRLLDWLAGAYISVFRGTPILVQLLIMFFIIFKNESNGLLIAIITFGINSGAYVAEIVRAGIMAVDPGQTEAGRSLGLSSGKTMFLIVMPQAIKNILPAFGNEFIALLKETSVVSCVTVLDLSRAGQMIRTRTAEPYFSLLFVAFIYFLLVFGFSKLLKVLERRLGKSDRG